MDTWAKLRSIGDLKFEFHNRHTYSDLANYAGKIKEIDDIKFKYNESYSGM